MISFLLDINFEMKVVHMFSEKQLGELSVFLIQISFLFIIAFLLTCITQADINLENESGSHVFGKAARRTQCILIQISFLFIIAFLLTCITQAVTLNYKPHVCHFWFNGYYKCHKKVCSSYTRLMTACFFFRSNSYITI